MRDIIIINYIIIYINEGGVMGQEQLRDLLSGIISLGLSAVAISKVTQISKIDLSRFKNGQICLVNSDAEKLQRFLEQTKIPESI